MPKSARSAVVKNRSPRDGGWGSGDGDDAELLEIIGRFPPYFGIAELERVGERGKLESKCLLLARLLYGNFTRTATDAVDGQVANGIFLPMVTR